MSFRVAVAHIVIRYEITSADIPFVPRDKYSLSHRNFTRGGGSENDISSPTIKLARRGRISGGALDSRVREEVSAARRSSWLAYFRARYSECRSNNGTLLFGPVAAASQSGAGWLRRRVGAAGHGNTEGSRQPELGGMTTARARWCNIFNGGCLG